MNKMGMEYEKNMFWVGTEKNIYSFHQPKVDLSLGMYMSGILPMR